jgi:uncharacterized membrane protein
MSTRFTDIYNLTVTHHFHHWVRVRVRVRVRVGVRVGVRVRVRSCAPLPRRVQQQLVVLHVVPLPFSVV